jgi:hypothetical protein
MTGAPVKKPYAFRHVTEIRGLGPKAEVGAEIQEAHSKSKWFAGWPFPQALVKRSLLLVLCPILIWRKDGVMQAPESISKCCIHLRDCRCDRLAIVDHTTEGSLQTSMSFALETSFEMRADHVLTAACSRTSLLSMHSVIALGL